MTTPASPSPRSGATNYRWIICGLLFFAATVNYVDRNILSLIKPILDQELGWTNEQYGAVNSIFQFAYGLGLLFFGWFVDRVGTKVGYTISIVGWSLAAMAHAFVFSVTGFQVARACLGFPEGGNFPSSIKAVALWFPKRERALATSIFNSGSNVGAILAPMLVPWIAYTWSWHAAFVIAGLAGFVWVAVWIPFYNVPEKIKTVNRAELEHIRSDNTGEPESNSRVSWLSLLGYRQTWSFMFGKFMIDPIWWFLLIWLPDFFKKAYHLDIKNSWMHLATIYTIITVLSIYGGFITGHLTKLGWTVTRARKTGMFIFALCVIPVFVATSMNVWVAVLLIALAGSAHQAFSANLYTTVSDMFPKYAVASVTGIGGLAGAIGGTIFPWYCGRVLDEHKAMGDEVAGYGHLLHICAFVYLFTFIIHHFIAPRFEPVKLKESSL